MFNLLFAVIVVIAIGIVYKINLMRRKTLWKTRLILRFIAYGCIWVPITTVYTYANVTKSSGLALEMGIRGYSLYKSVKAIPKKIIRNIDKRLAIITPRYGRRIARKTRTLVKAPLTLTREVAHQTLNIGPKPRISFGQKAWRVTWSTISGVILTPVSIIKGVFA